ncbi:hypothetical protein [Salipiger sp. PrR003]|uniref:hypothetical protein n=1 Tax=Salipiger sp. PrR003 TaxID=2706776 RepID=UPI0013DAE74D|nr:hypothetical protein [Salipiger sp. PrR003]NDV50400.1 hypothetical protein [Salipiger sp. PrR003]
MDVEAYERGVPDLPQRLRVYAMAHQNVELTLTHEQALLLADDLERGIATREIDFKGLQSAMSDLADATGGR